MVQSRTIRVMCVDDHAFLVEGLRARLAEEPDMEFMGSRPNLVGLIDLLVEKRPDVVLLDIEIPGPDVFEVLEGMRQTVPTVRTVMLTAYVRDHYIDSAIAAGAWGYLTKTDDPDAIVAAIRRVAGGEFAFSPGVARRAQAARASPSDYRRPVSRLQALTPREQQILRMIGKGQTRTHIAIAIHRSPKTVDAHRASIMEKLGIHDRVELARFAIREGLVEI